MLRLLDSLKPRNARGSAVPTLQSGIGFRDCCSRASSVLYGSLCQSRCRACTIPELFGTQPRCRDDLLLPVTAFSIFDFRFWILDCLFRLWRNKFSIANSDSVLSSAL